MKKLGVLCGLVTLVAAVAVAHPHFRKTVTAKIGDNDVSVTFFTVPANMSHLEGIADGQFVSPGQPTLEVPIPLKAGSTSIPAGTYLMGAIKKGEGWTMVLHPGRPARGEEPDLSKLIELPSQFRKSADTAEHLVVDIGPGWGKNAGKAVVVLAFGNLWLDGAISDA